MTKALRFAATTLALAVLGTSVAPPADAYCSPVQEEGRWGNLSEDSTEITEIQISYSNSCTAPHGKWERYDGPAWYVAVTGKCGDEPCEWGRTGAEQTNRKPHYLPLETPEGMPAPKQTREIGVYPIFAPFNRRGTQKFLFISMSPEGFAGRADSEKDLLAVRLYTDYPEPGPPDTVEELKFRRLSLPQEYARPFTLVDR